MRRPNSSAISHGQHFAVNYFDMSTSDHHYGARRNLTADLHKAPMYVEYVVGVCVSEKLKKKLSVTEHEYSTKIILLGKYYIRLTAVC